MSDNNKPTQLEQLDAIKVLLGACLKDLVASKKVGSIPDFEKIIKTVSFSKELANQVQGSLTGNDSEISMAIEKTGMLLNRIVESNIRSGWKLRQGPGYQPDLLSGSCGWSNSKCVKRV